MPRVPLILSGYGSNFYASKAYKVEELTLALPDTRLKVVQLTDISCRYIHDPDMMRRYAEQVIALQPGCICPHRRLHLELDIVSPKCLEEMALVQAKYVPSPRWGTMNTGLET